MKRFFKLGGKAVALLDCVIFTAVAALALSCSKSDVPQEQEVVPGEASVVTVSIVPETKGNATRAVGSEHGSSANDNTVQTLEFFIFRTDDNSNGVLDTYKKFEGEELVSLSGIKINTTTGAKMIYAVANSHRDDWQDVKTLNDFKTVVSSLGKENVKSFTMVGSVEAVLQVSTSVTFSISRLVARVQLGGIRTAFAGTPYEGMTLENVKVYLTNAYASKLYANGTDDELPVVYNSKKLVAEDVEACSMEGMIYDELEGSITDEGYSTPHYFYCYENVLGEQTEEKRFTRLVIEGTLNGNTYYYPININQEGFGYVEENGSKGVQRNTSYSVDVTICRPGSTDPDKNLEHGALTAQINVLDWSTIPVVYVNF